MAVKNIQYTWDRSDTSSASTKHSPLFPKNDKNQWYLELVRNENPLTVQLRQNHPHKIYFVQNLNISIGSEISGVCNLTRHDVKHKNITVSFQVNEEFNYNHLLLANQEFSDFTIVVQNTEIPVHKVVLATRSPVFYAMLKTNFLEKNTNSTNIIDFDKETISALIRFIYTSEIDLTSSEIDVKNLLAAADKYEVNDLILNSENYLVQNLKVSNVLGVLIFAEQYNFAGLKEKALDFTIKNLSSFSSFESLKPLDPYPHLYRSLISKKLTNPSRW